VIKAFLEYYVRSSVVRRPCLGPEGRKEVRTVKTGTTLQDKLSELVKYADDTVLEPKRLENPREMALWRISYSSRAKGYHDGPAYEIGKV
jgi:hypothetical protein